MKKLEEIFWDGENFNNKKGDKVNPIPIGEPHSEHLGFSKGEETNKIIEKIINEYTPETSELYLGANAYCIGTSQPNDNGSPVQFYKIKTH